MVKIKIDGKEIVIPRVTKRYIPSTEKRVLAVVHIPSTLHHYPESRGPYSEEDGNHILKFCHIFDSHWEDEELNKVYVVAWIDYTLVFERG